MKNFLRCLFLVLSITVGLQQRASASHAMGADISYTNVGRDSFIITVNFYRDCAGITADASVFVDYTSLSCGYSNTVQLNRTSTIQPQNIPNGSEVSALCGNSINNSTCHNGGTLPGVQQYQYSGLVVLPSRCVDWVFSYDVSSRNAAVTNLLDPDFEDLYVEATLNNTVFPQNNSPLFTNRPVPYFCYLDSIQYNQGTIDVDGDSLVYTLINPMGAGGAPITYLSPYSVSNPLSVNGAFAFNSATGQMSFVPSVGGQAAVITVRVDEYRNGVLIGSTIRDIQVNILGGPVCTPPYASAASGGIDPASIVGGTLLPDTTGSSSYSLVVCPNTQLTFSITFAGDSVYLSSNALQALPGATFVLDTLHKTGNIVDSIRGRFTWAPTTADTGIHVFSINYGIRACPIDRTSSRSITINVLKAVNAGPDKIYCTAGVPVQLQATGGTIFSWSPAAGLSSTSISNPLARPTVTTDYVLTGQCNLKDTVRVKVVPNFISSIAPQSSNINICRNSLVGLSVQTDAAFAPYTYQWTPASGLVDSAGNPTSTAAGVFASPTATTTYAVYVTSDSGCTIVDTVRLTVAGSGPKVVINASKTQVCSGDTIRLSSGVFPVACGGSTGSGSCSSSNPPVAKSYGTGTLTSSVSPFGGSNPTYRYQTLYRAANLTAAGLTAGTVVRLSFTVNAKNSSRVYNHFTIRMGCTSSTQLSTSNWENVSTQVYYSASQLINTGANTFTLNQPYDWDGFSNIVIELCFGDTNTSAGGDDRVVSTAVTYPATMAVGTSSAAAGCSLASNTIPANQLVQQVPNITFLFCAASVPSYTYAWSPAGGLSSANTATTVATVTQPTTYVLNVSDGNCIGSDLIRVFPDSTTLIVPHDTSLCSLATGDSLRFQVTVGGPIVNQCGVNGNTCVGPLATTTIGNGTATNLSFAYPAPFGNYYGSSKQQFLYLASDLAAAGVKPGRVKELAFFISSLAGTTNTYRSYTIQQKCTSKSQLTIGTPETGLTTVYNPRNVTPVVGTNNFVLDNAFDWDGTSNIVLQVCFDNSAQFINYTSNAVSPLTSTGYIASTCYNSDDDPQCATNAVAVVTDGFRYRPNVRFSMCDATPPANITWTPATGLSNTNSVDVKAHPTVTTTYKVTLRTSLGCTKTDSFTVRIGASFAHTLSHDTTICAGNSTTLLATGGTSYSWAPAIGLSCTTCANPVATPSITTKYKVTITDATQGCTLTDSVTVTLAPAPLPPFGRDTCFTDSLVLHAGPGFTTYAWSVPNGNNPDLVVRAAGTYSVTLTNATGCIVRDTIVVSTRSRPAVDLGPDRFACNGSNVTLDAGNGFASYSWSPITAVTETLTVSTSNAYSVSVTDQNGCASRDTVNVTFNRVPVVNLGNDTILCNADTLRLTANNGPGYTYLWSNGTTDSILLVTSALAQPVSVTVSGGGALCTASDAINVTFRAPVVVNIGNDTAICLGQSVIFDAGAGFTSYLWNTIPPATTRTITALLPGTYKVTVTDNIGCRGMDSAVLTINNTPVTIAPAGDTICAGDSVTLTASIAGQPLGTIYLWNTLAVSNSITVHTSGNYCVTVTPLTGCPGFACDTVAVVPHPTVNLGPDTTVCANATLVLNAGIQPTGSSYLWDDASTAVTRTITTAGTYFVDVTNATGCVTRDSIVVTYRPAAVIDAGNDTTVCRGQSVTFNATTGFTTYQWTLPDATTTTGSSVLATASGTYTVRAVDANGCLAVDSVKLSHIVVAVSLGADKSICGNDSVLLDAGAGFSAYNWSTGATTQTTYITAATAGSISVTVTLGSCTGSDTVLVSIKPNATPSLGNDTTLCAGATLTLNPGTFTVYNWSNNTSASTLTVTAAGTYSVSVSDGSTCTGADTIVVSYFPGVAVIAPDNDTLCRDASITLTAPTGYTSYVWSDGSTGSTLVVDTAGTYTLTVTDANGCTNTVTDTITDGKFILGATADPTPINVGQSAALNPNVHPIGNYTYVWTPGASLNDSTSATPTATPTETTTYTVLVTNTTSQCFDTSRVTLVVYNQGLFVFPEAFTPNHDGHNDFFGMISSGSNVVIKEFRIYNRFGALVHSAPIPWNGQVSGADQPADTYVFTTEIEVTDASGVHTYKHSGAFTLIR